MSERWIDSVSVGGKMRSHPAHVHTMSVANGVIIHCLDCVLVFVGTPEEAVTAWNEHLPDEEPSA